MPRQVQHFYDSGSNQNSKYWWVGYDLKLNDFVQGAHPLITVLLDYLFPVHWINSQTGFVAVSLKRRFPVIALCDAVMRIFVSLLLIRAIEVTKNSTSYPSIQNSLSCIYVNNSKLLHLGKKNMSRLCVQTQWFWSKSSSICHRSSEYIL